MGLIVPKAIFLRWSVRDLRYSQRFLSQKSSPSHRLVLGLQKIKSVAKPLGIDRSVYHCNTIQYNTIMPNPPCLDMALGYLRYRWLSDGCVLTLHVMLHLSVWMANAGSMGI